VAIRLANRPELEALAVAWETDRDRRAAEARQAAVAAAAQLAANVPGLAEVRAAVSASVREMDRSRQDFQRMMDRGDGIGPAPERTDLHETAKTLRAQYPRAAAYLAAEGQSMASNCDKAAAGAGAMKLLATGGDLAEAVRIMRDWLPAETWND
jgi:hypothetical protein